MNQQAPLVILDVSVYKRPQRAIEKTLCERGLGLLIGFNSHVDHM